MLDNSLDQRRPDSTFNTFDVSTPERLHLRDNLRRLADGLIQIAPRMTSERYPFRAGRILSIWGKPGVGKSHLLEAFANHLLQGAPSLESARKVQLFRGNFTTDGGASLGMWFRDTPIALLDDVYAEHQSIADLHPRTDVRTYMDFVTWVYEHRALVITTSNFPITEGIAAKIREVDTVGRISSRLQELLSGSSEFELQGPDFRQAIAEQQQRDPFSPDF